MTSRQGRRERRETERKAKKLLLKKARIAGAPVCALPVEHVPSLREMANPGPTPLRPPVALPPAPVPDGFVSQNMRSGAVSMPPTEPNGFVSQKASWRAEINRTNAQRSSGPRSIPGKLASSRNSLKHGLASGRVIIPGEDAAALDALLDDLLADHQPATPTEHLLVKEMAESYWLSQRAIRLQNECFTPDGVNEKQLSLFLRYQATYQRAFYKALNALTRLKKEACPTQGGFVSQRRSQANQFVRQNAPATGFVSQNSPELHPNSTCEPKGRAA